MEWSEVIENKALQDLPFKIELNEWGNIIMTPASNRHGYVQVEIASLLGQIKTSGTVLSECSIATPKGVKVADVAWGSPGFFSEHGLDTPYSVAPEVCVEIRSPSNSVEELREKKDGYLAKGAKEVWVCDEDGHMTFYSIRGEARQSGLFPAFPPVLLLEFPPG